MQKNKSTSQETNTSTMKEGNEIPFEVPLNKKNTTAAKWQMI